MNSNNEANSFEKNIKKLEQIVHILDKGDAPLDEMLKHYEEGMALVRSSREYLDKAEQKVIDISRKNLTKEKSDEELV